MVSDSSLEAVKGAKAKIFIWPKRFLLTTASFPGRTLQGSSRYSKIDIARRYVFVPAAGSEGVLPKIRNMKMSHAILNNTSLPKEALKSTDQVLAWGPFCAWS